MNRNQQNKNTEFLDGFRSDSQQNSMNSNLQNAQQWTMKSITLNHHPLGNSSSNNIPIASGHILNNSSQLTPN